MKKNFFYFEIKKMLKFLANYEKKIFFILKLKYLKFWANYEKNFFYFEIKIFKILDVF